jgi:hypothetical protein
VGRALQGSWAERIEAQRIDAGSQQGFQGGATHEAQPNYGHIARLHDKISMLPSGFDRLSERLSDQLVSDGSKLLSLQALGSTSLRRVSTENNFGQFDKIWFLLRLPGRRE